MAQNNHFSKSLGAEVRARRKQLRLTQQRLGELAGVGVIFISQLERGKKTVRLDKLLLVLNVLGLDLKIVPVDRKAK